MSGMSAHSALGGAALLGTVLLLLGPARSAAAQMPPPPAPPENPITPHKATLGKILFFEEQISSDNTMACATCHISAAGGGDPRAALDARHPGADGLLGTADDVFGSPGVPAQDALGEYQPSGVFGFDPQVTPRLAPSAVGAQYFTELFWDGRASSTFVDPETGLVSISAGGALESQAVGPPVSDVEMAHEARDWSQITAKLATCEPLKLASNLTPDLVTALNLRNTYPGLFQAAFGSPEITAERIAYAIATYERTLVPDQTPWDAFNQGDPQALTPRQVQGLNIFNGRGNCNFCHVPPIFTDDFFHNVGLRPPAEDPGRFNVSGLSFDWGRFKTPSVRNAGLLERYFHNGQFSTLEEVMLFYARGGDFTENRSVFLFPFALPPGDLAALVDFVENGLTDPRVANEQFPFDRPTLHSETPAATPHTFGAGVAGSGGFTPRILAHAPPNLGNLGFKIGVASALGGARAHLLVRTGRGSMGSGMDVAPGSGLAVPRGVLRLHGAGPGDGFGTLTLPIPLSDRFLGKRYYARWFVEDPAAPGGFASSETVGIEVF